MPDSLVLLAFPFVGAAIGWFTNFLAIKMLFKPRRPIHILGFKLQGLIPKRRTDIAHRLAEAITRDLISDRDIAELLSQMDWEEEISRFVEKIIDEDMAKTGLKKFPVVGFMADNFLFHVKYVLAREITTRLDRHRQGIMERVNGRLDLKRLVLKKIESFDLDYLEKLIISLVEKELRAIEIIGGILGFTVGTVHVILGRLL